VTINLRSRVTIKNGPLKGVVGVVVRSVGLDRFAVRIDFLRCKATVDIAGANLVLVAATPKADG